MKIAINTETATLQFTFDQEGVAPYTFNAARVAAPLRKYAELHGFSDKLRDKAALARNAGGKVVTITDAMRRAAIVAQAEYLYNARTWNQRAAAIPKDSEFILLVTAAIAKVKGLELEPTAAWIDSRCTDMGLKVKQFLEGMVQNKDVQAAYLKLLSERVGPAVVDADKELAALG